HVPWIRAQRAAQRGVGARRILAVTQEGGGDARVQLAPRPRLQLGRRVDRLGQGREGGGQAVLLTGQRLEQRQQGALARGGRDVRIDDQRGRAREVAQQHRRPQQAAARLEALRGQ